MDSKAEHSRFPASKSPRGSSHEKHSGGASETPPELCFICGEDYAVAGPQPVICEDGRPGFVCLDCAEDSTVSREDIPSCWERLSGDRYASAVPLFEDCEVCGQRLHRARIEVESGFVVCKEGGCAAVAAEWRSEGDAYDRSLGIRRFS